MLVYQRVTLGTLQISEPHVWLGPENLKIETHKKFERSGLSLVLGMMVRSQASLHTFFFMAIAGS